MAEKVNHPKSKSGKMALKGAVDENEEREGKLETQRWERRGVSRLGERWRESGKT